MPRSRWIFISIPMIAGATLATPVLAAEVSVSVEPTPVDFVQRSFLDDRHSSLELSSTWSLGESLDLRIGWRGAEPPQPVVMSPFFRESVASGYSLSFSSRAFGPIELYGRVEVLDPREFATRDLKLALKESRRITIAGASARWRPNNEARWGLEAGANRASDRPTFIGIGVFFTF